MSKEMVKQLKLLLEGSENPDAPYDRLSDEDLPKIGMKRKPVLTLRAINELKKIRNQKREELAQDSIFVPYIYGPQENPEAGGLGGGLGGL